MHWRDRVGTERSLSIFADPSPGAGSAGTSRRKVPLSENSLLRKEDLGLTLTEMGLEKPVQTREIKRKRWYMTRVVQMRVPCNHHFRSALRPQDPGQQLFIS